MARPAEPRDRSVVHLRRHLSLTRLTLGAFLLCQAADGALTYGATAAFGTAAEGNPILATWMEILGIGPTLVVAKVACAAAGILLYIRGVHLALAGVTAFYAFGAVIPWLRILSATGW